MLDWWTADRIDSTVTPRFVSSKLDVAHQVRLSKPLAFGDNLTDDTYLDWILEKGKRLFLIFVDIGNPEFIFEAIDRSYDDDDLPMEKEAIGDMGMSPGKGSVLDKAFFRTQYRYLIRDIRAGIHIDFTEEERIPIDFITKRSALLGERDCDSVIIRSERYKRRRMAMGGEDNDEKVQFLQHLTALKKLRHENLISVFATYTQLDTAYILSTPAIDVCLKAFLDDQPRSFKQVSKMDKRDILLQWVHSLTKALAFLHENGHAHQAIRSTNVFIRSPDHIFLGELATLDVLQKVDQAYDRDVYDHSSPELWQYQPVLQELPPETIVQHGGGRTTRRIAKQKRATTSSSRSRASGSSDPIHSPRSSYRRSDGSSSLQSPPTSPSSVAPSLLPPTIRMSNLSIATSHSSSSSSNTSAITKRTVINKLHPTPTESLNPSDVFSLCTIHVYLIGAIFSLTSNLQFASRFSPKALRQHLGKKNRTAGRGGAVADTSFHANLSQVHEWMGRLEKEAQARDEKTKDEDVWQTVGRMTQVISNGLHQDPEQRWTANDGLRQMRAILENWEESRPASRAVTGHTGHTDDETEDDEDGDAIINLDDIESPGEFSSRHDDLWSTPELDESSLGEDNTISEDGRVSPKWPLPAKSQLRKPPNATQSAGRAFLSSSTLSAQSC
ncbi:hypothetical protein MMC25_003934 [Agyrium rufum]|nr:hypothetical protein [Agyrium rufum]